MMKFYFTLFVTAFSTVVFAQKNGMVKGIAIDSLSRTSISSATVSILDKKDSSLVSFSMTDSKGNFEIAGLPNGDYRVLITHINHHNKNLSFTISESSREVNLGSVILVDKNLMLDEVLIKKEDPPVTLINDTVQYNAGSFKTVPNASVEQLLKKLPGVQVEKDGTIKAQGEKVTRVLVDGKEFFGNDPKMATKNLPADAIDKVQVYDKQSDQAQLTGFEDGNYEKTINLKLKKDKKKGMFGKASLGGGTNERIEGRFNVNSFKGARQMSIIGMGNNTNAEGFSFMDIMSFRGGMNRATGGNTFSISSADAASMGLSGAGSGINTIWGTGINYNNIIGTKLDLQSSYFYNHYNPDVESHKQRQYISTGSNNFYEENSFSKNNNNSHKLTMNLLYQIDSFHAIRFIPNISLQNTFNKSRSDYQTLLSDHSKLNDGMSNNYSNSNGFNFDNSIMFSKKFRKKGRTFSATLQTGFNESRSDGHQFSNSYFYSKDGNVASAQTINQQAFNEGGLSSYNARLVFTERIFKYSMIELNGSKSNRANTSDITTYNYNQYNSKYDQLIDSLTNDFRNTYGFENAGLRFRTQKNKYNYFIGINWQQALMEGKIISGTKDSTISKTFNNLLFAARFQYNISKFRSFTLTYNTSTNQPSLSQLQPVPDVSNPLYIREGNPDLKQEYNHRLQANLNLVRPFENRNLFAYITFQTTKNKIVNAESFDSLSGKRSSRPVNVDAVYNLNNTITYSIPVGFVKGTVEFSNRSNYFMGKQFVDNQLNDINTTSFGPGIRFNLDPTAKLNVTAGYDLNYNSTTYSLNAASNNHYLVHSYSTSVEWELPKGFTFSTDFSYIVNTQRAAGFNAKIPVWNAFVSKQILNFNRGEIKLSATDLLNKNIGISRNTNQSYIEDLRVKTLPRFFMLSFTYNLTKTGLNKAGKGGMRINVR